MVCARSVGHYGLGFTASRDADRISGAYVMILISQAGKEGLPLSSLICD